MLTDAYLRTLPQLDGSVPQFSDQLHDILGRREFDERISTLQTDDLMEAIDYLDKALDNLDPTGVVSKQVLRKLQGICTSRMRVPSSHVLASTQLNVNKGHVASGGFSDVFQGTYGGLEVCVKRLRVAVTGSREKMLYREAVIWKRLIHPSVVPFTGVTFDPLQIVSEWMSGGNLTTHIEANPRTNRIALLVDVAEGLNYLHQCDVVHGDLKGPNIMVDANSHARITDFGLARDQGIAEETSIPTDGTARWTAPEILQGRGVPSKEADVFSFAMVMVEAFTGSPPFDLHLSITVALAIMRGDRPSRPLHPTFTHGLWELMERCWSQEPDSRPDMLEVLRILHDPETSEPTISGPSVDSHQRTYSAPSRPNQNYGRQSRDPGQRSVSLVSPPKPATTQRPRTGLGGTGKYRHRVHSVMGTGGGMLVEDSRLSDLGEKDEGVDRSGARQNNNNAPGLNQQTESESCDQSPVEPKEDTEPSDPRMNGGRGGIQQRGAQTVSENPLDTPDFPEKERRPWWSSCSVVCQLAHY